MNLKSICIGIGTMFVITIGILIVGGKTKQSNKANNWNWSNNWNSSASAAVPPAVVTPPSIQPTPPLPVAPETPLVVKTYAEAIEASAKSGKQIVLFFSGDFCPYCIKMKNQTLSDDGVKKALEKYIFLIIDTTSDRETTRKFKIRGIPAYIITDKTEKAIKAGEGFKSVDEFLNWLS